MKCSNGQSLAKKYFSEGDIRKLFYGFFYAGLSRKLYYMTRFKYGIFQLKGKRENSLKEIKVNNSRMYISLNDNGISNELYNLGKREHFCTDFMYGFLKEDDIVIDIGANIGYYALLESKLLKNGKVFAIEPIPSNLYILKENIKLNNYDNISTYQLAIGESNGSSKMYVYDKCNWCSLNKNIDGKLLKEIDVETQSLDYFVRKYVDGNPTFIRMDVEGFEYHIIKGALSVFAKSKHLKLNIELHPHLMSKDEMDYILTTLENNKFKIKAITNNPPAHIYKSINTFNWIRRSLGLPEYGLDSGNYDDLKKILNEGSCSPIVFFEKG